ncbi:MAG: hypothetical protein ACLFTB_02895 [Desulfovibrionales bacterium]
MKRVEILAVTLCMILAHGMGRTELHEKESWVESEVQTAEEGRQFWDMQRLPMQQVQPQESRDMSFEGLDTDGDNIVILQEFFFATGEGDQVDLFFTLDKDDDGVIRKDELQQGIEQGIWPLEREQALQENKESEGMVNNGFLEGSGQSDGELQIFPLQ